MSRILSGAQEPKLGLAHVLAKTLGVSLDYLVDDSLEAAPSGQMAVLTEDESTILKIVRRLGTSEAIDRLLGVAEPDAGDQTPKPAEDEGATPHLHQRSGQRKGHSHG
jgi:hypothetical protein